MLKVFPTENRALVTGVNMVKRHQRQTATQQGGIVSKEAPIHLSNHRPCRSARTAKAARAVGFKMSEATAGQGRFAKRSR